MRQQIANALTSARRATDVELIDVVHVRVKPVRKWGNRSLGETVAMQREHPVGRFAWNHFRDGYDSERDRQRFSDVLQSVIGGRGRGSVELAAVFRAWLDEMERRPVAAVARRHEVGAWLAAFFRDEPEWLLRLRAWIDQLRVY